MSILGNFWMICIEGVEVKDGSHVAYSVVLPLHIDLSFPFLT